MNYWKIGLCCLIPSLSIAQSGPGGIGKNDGTSALEIWLAADTAVYIDSGMTFATNFDQILQWNDLSGNGNHAIQTDSIYQPSLVEVGLNGIPVVNFDRNELRIDYDISPSVLPTITVYIVAEHNTALSNKSKLFGHDNMNYDRSIGFDTRCSATTFNYFGNNWSNCFITPVASEPFVVACEYSDSTFTGWFNGYNSIPTIANSNGDGESFLTIGGITDRNFGEIYDEFWDGGIAEFIVFNSSLNSAQHIILNNYLSAKYNIPLATCDVYKADEVVEGNYDHQVAGIGKLDALNSQTSSKGMGMVEVSSADDLDENEFFMWGHNNGNRFGIEIDDVPIGIEARIERVWKVSEQDTSGAIVNVGNLDISFDLSGMGNVTEGDLRLLIDTDGDFSDGATVVSGGINDGNNMFRFPGVSGMSDGLFFTLSTSNIQTPLFVQVVDFEVRKEREHIVINWSTHSEVNNDFFLLEKSEDGENWAFLSKVKGAGTSSKTLFYSFLDDPNGSIKKLFYRLSHIDFNGVKKEEGVRTIFLDKEIKAFISPNPSEGNITVQLSEIGSSVYLRNSVGKMILKEENCLNDFCHMNMSELPNGIYFIEIKTTTNQVVKKIQLLR